MLQNELFLFYTVIVVGYNVKTEPPCPVSPVGMLLIPAGEFQMGSAAGSPNEQPVHTVLIAMFYMDRYEVTNAQYKQFVDATVQWRKERIDNDYPIDKANHLVYVSWYTSIASP